MQHRDQQELKDTFARFMNREVPCTVSSNTTTHPTLVEMDDLATQLNVSLTLKFRGVPAAAQSLGQGSDSVQLLAVQVKKDQWQIKAFIL